MQPVLCLFDIDGTLIKGTTRDKPTSPSLNSAFSKVYGIADFNFVKYSGYDGTTDLNIVLGVGKKNGISEEILKNKFDEFIEEATNYMKACYQDYKNKILPCAKTLVGVLTKKKVTCGVLTGNAEKKGWWKLKETGFDKFLKFGAFGDSVIDRNELFSIALKEAEKYSGLHFVPENIYIIGDTGHDVEVAKVHGLKSIAVATGKMTEEELRGCGADFVMPDLTKTKMFLNIIGVK